MLAVVVLWFFVSTPLVFLGSYFGFKKDPISQPVRTNQIPRVVPPQPWYLTGLPSTLVGGVLPFGAVFIELFFIMSSIWLHQIYYVFGFLCLVLLILIVTSAEIAIVMCYFQLCSEDYNWWWRSFLTPAASSLYVFLYAVMYFVTKLEITAFVSGLLCFCYMGLVPWAFFLMTGCVGFISCLLFVRKIFGAIKVD
jgi:transmembrane 9 superfamily member 2/4